MWEKQDVARVKCQRLNVRPFNPRQAQLPVRHQVQVKSIQKARATERNRAAYDAARQALKADLVGNL